MGTWREKERRDRGGGPLMEAFLLVLWYRDSVDLLVLQNMLKILYYFHKSDSWIQN